MNRWTRALGTVAVAGAMVGTSPVLAASHSAPANVTPARPPASAFSARVDNQWFPLVPGTRYVYTGVKDDRPSRDVVTVTRRIKTIQNVPCVIVEDRYFGEDTAELDRDGKVTTTEGTWTSGLDGATAGLFMPARPSVGQVGRQEYYKGHAEDHFRVIGLLHTTLAPGAANGLLIQETTPLEPGTVDHKLYVRGIGVVFEQTEKGGSERNELVSVTHVG